jgi:hypothetical protein
LFFEGEFSFLDFDPFILEQRRFKRSSLGLSRAALLRLLASSGIGFDIGVVEGYGTWEKV